MVKIGKKKLRLSSGKVITFKSGAARERYERVAQAIKHGWKPTGKAAKKPVKKSGTKRKSTARKSAPKRKSAKRK